MFNWDWMLVERQICKPNIQQNIKLIDTGDDDCQGFIRPVAADGMGRVFLQNLPIYGDLLENNLQDNLTVTVCYTLLHPGKDFCSGLN